MKNILSVATTLAAVLAQSANAHYIFSKLIVGGVESEDWQYIRQTTRAENYMPTKFVNTFDDLTPNDDDFRCNLGSFGNAANTEVAEVAAGDTLGMKLFFDAQIQHPGPGSVCKSPYLKLIEHRIADVGMSCSHVQSSWKRCGL